MVASKVEARQYVRLSPTVLFRIPECYGNGQKVTACPLCPVSKQCRLKVKSEWR